MPPKAQFMQKWHSPWHPMIKPRYKVINRDQPSPIRTRRIKNQVKSELYCWLLQQDEQRTQKKLMEIVKNYQHLGEKDGNVPGI